MVKTILFFLVRVVLRHSFKNPVKSMLRWQSKAVFTLKSGWERSDIKSGKPEKDSQPFRQAAGQETAGCFIVGI